MKNLTSAQRIFIEALAKNQAPTRSPNNRTARSLERMELVKWAILVGWTLTAKGVRLLADEGHGK